MEPQVWKTSSHVIQLSFLPLEAHIHPFMNFAYPVAKIVRFLTSSILFGQLFLSPAALMIKKQQISNPKHKDGQFIPTCICATIILDPEQLFPSS